MIWSAIKSIYSTNYPTTLVYMLQSTEYQLGPYLKWYWRTQDFSKVSIRRQLDLTKTSKVLRLFLRLGIIIQILIGLWVLYLWHWHSFTGGLEFGFAIIISYPITWAHLITVPVWLGRILITGPREKNLIKQSEKIFKKSKAVKIAVAGSYGKTSMKELLLTVLSNGKKVEATPANKNVPLSHAEFAKSLSPDAEVLIIEYGEGKPGDVERFAHTTHPTHAVITGIAPAHLDHYPKLSTAAEDIFSLGEYLHDKNVFVNRESLYVEPYIKPEYISYSSDGVEKWAVSNVVVNINSLEFTLSKAKRNLKLKTSLIGRHQIGPISLAVFLALKLGLTEEQIINGVAAANPFEHRMQPYLLNGAWIIDDTYNGNIEGIRAGTELLSELKANRKIYVTPGLVDQGIETKKVHLNAGELIAKANPNMVILMKNSVTEYIQTGLKQGNYSGEIRIEKEPLKFYNNLGDFVAAGDIVMMQNDWPDNYR